MVLDIRPRAVEDHEMDVTDRMVEAASDALLGEFVEVSDNQWRRALSAALAAAWVPTSERLPQDGAFVLVYVPVAGRFAAYYSADWGFDYAGYHDEPVTHWMALPEPPKE